MKENDLFNTALKKAMALCAGREVCRKDISVKLASWGVSENERLKITELLAREKYIDEARYSSAFVRDRYHQQKWGRVKITAALRTKGIEESTIQQALGQIDNGEYLTTIRDLISSHRKKVKAKNKYDLKGKLLRYGLSKGFESHLLYDILGENE